MSAQAVVNASALFLVSLTIGSAPLQAESPLAVPTATLDPRLLAKVIPPRVTNSVSALSDPARANQSDNLTEKDLLFLLTARLQPKQENGELELELMRLVPPWKPIPVTDGPIDVRILDKPVSGLSSQFGIRFEVLRGEKPRDIYFANAKARLFRDVWLAPSALRRGTTLDQVYLQQDRRDVINFRDATFSTNSLGPSVRLSDLRLTEYIQAGGIILARHVQLRPVMFRGQEVQAVIKDEFMMVSAKVEVLEDGAPGQFVRARNPRTKKEIRGKVINEDTIQVVF